MKRSIIFFYLIFLFVIGSQSYAQETGNIQIECEPGVLIFLDGDYQGKTKSVLNGIILQDIRPGEHKIKAVKEGYLPIFKNFDLNKGEITKIDIDNFLPNIKITQKGKELKTAMKNRTGSLLIQSLPIECIISISKLGIVNSKKQKDQWLAENIPIGQYNVQAEAFDIQISQKVRIMKDKRTRILLNFFKEKTKKSVKKSALTVNTIPDDARVIITNSQLDYHDAIKLDPGDYKLQIEKPGYKNIELTKSLSPGQDLEFLVELEKKTAKTKKWTDPLVGIEFIWVPSGCYKMRSEAEHSQEKSDHKVCVEGFWMGKYEITQEQWQEVMGDNPSQYEKGSSYPVENVSWNDVQDFIESLNKENDHPGKYRLPSEAEWEYAFRSMGNQEKYAGSDKADRVAWYFKNSGGHIHKVGTKEPNGLGLYDMSGNVWEWCQDLYYPEKPSNKDKNSKRVIRGGSWYNTKKFIGSSARYGISPDNDLELVGFRLVRTD